MKFEQDETVLYRLMLAKIRSIINMDGRSCYLLDSLESDHCQYQVPVENRMDHLQKLPDSASCQALLHRVQDLPMQKITRNAIARSCKSVLEQNDIVAWLSLLKTMHADKMSAEASGRKLPESEKHFYETDPAAHQHHPRCRDASVNRRQHPAAARCAGRKRTARLLNYCLGYRDLPIRPPMVQGSFFIAAFPQRRSASSGGEAHCASLRLPRSSAAWASAPAHHSGRSRPDEAHADKHSAYDGI